LLAVATGFQELPRSTLCERDEQIDQLILLQNLSKDKLAQAIAGCDLDPAILREGKEGLFEERYYGSIFPTADPYYYLVRYWVMDYVSYSSRGYPERAYAKWLVLNFVWSKISPLLRSKARIERLGQDWEQNHNSVYYLWKMSIAVYLAALRFYRQKRGKGAKATDVSTFFRRRKLPAAFTKFWNSKANNQRATFQKHLKKFEQALNEDTD